MSRLFDFPFIKIKHRFVVILNSHVLDNGKSNIDFQSVVAYYTLNKVIHFSQGLLAVLKSLVYILIIVELSKL